MRGDSLVKSGVLVARRSGAPHRRGHAPDLAHRRRHQPRPARGRPAAARVRRRQAQGAVVVRRAKPGERLETLDGVDRVLSARGSRHRRRSRARSRWPASWAARAPRSPRRTTEVALESAHFDSTVTTRTSRRHGLASEASRRFERGVDPELARYGAELAALMLLGDAAGESVHLTEVGTPAAARAGRAAGRGVRAARWPGLSGGDHHAAARTGRLHASAATDPLVVQPPSWRPDLTRAADLVEEVLRLEGYRTIPGHAAAGAGRPRADGGPAHPAPGHRRRRRRRLRRGAAAAVRRRRTSPTGSASIAGDPRRAAVRVANPLSDDEAYLRTSLLPGLLGAAARNVSRGNPDVALFEVGTVFRGNPAAGRRRRSRRSTGVRRPRSCSRSKRCCRCSRRMSARCSPVSGSVPGRCSRPALPTGPTPSTPLRCIAAAVGTPSWRCPPARVRAVASRPLRRAVGDDCRWPACHRSRGRVASAGGRRRRAARRVPARWNSISGALLVRCRRRRRCCRRCRPIRRPTVTSRCWCRPG